MRHKGSELVAMADREELDIVPCENLPSSEAFLFEAHHHLIINQILASISEEILIETIALRACCRVELLGCPKRCAAVENCGVHCAIQNRTGTHAIDNDVPGV